MNIFDELISKGYYIGSSYDILTEQELVKLENVIANDIKLGYDVLLSPGNYHSYKWHYNLTAGRKPFDPYPYDPNFNKPVPHNLISKKKQLIKSQGKVIDQQWYFTDFETLKQSYPDIKVVKEKIKKFVNSIYNSYDNVVVDGLQATVYEVGDFIEPHHDGKNENRLCALIIYLGSPADYDANKGGRLFLQPNEIPFDRSKSTLYDMTISIEPVRPTYVLLDFTKHNVLHAVEPVKEHFSRFSLICFPTFE